MSFTATTSFDDLVAPPEADREEETWVSRSTLLLYLGTAFFLGVLNQFSIRMVGLMPVDEILLCGIVGHAVLWLIIARRLPAAVPAPRILALLLICQVVAFAGYMVSDLWRESLPGDMVRGWSRMLFLAIDIGGFGLLFGASNRAFVAMQVGLIFSFGASLVSGPLFGDYWKFAFAFPVTLAVLLGVSRWLGDWAAIGACITLGVLHNWMDFRSLGGVCVLLGGLLGLRQLALVARKLTLIGMLLLALGISPWVGRWMFSDTGTRATRSNVERSAMLQAAWEGFVKSPILGNGSWFSNSNVMDEFLTIRTQNARLAGVGGFADDDADGMAIHSQILVALAEGGIFGATFFFAYGLLLLWGIWFCLTDAPWDWTLPIRLFVLLVAFWNLLMSPFSGTHRVEIAMAVGLLLMLWRQRAQLRNFDPPRIALDQCPA
jgi:hypothetical protein